MDNRGRTFIVVCGLTLLPIACAVPVFWRLDYLDDLVYRATSPHHSTGWILTLLTVFSMYCEFQALLRVENKLSGTRDIYWVLRIPVGLVSAIFLVVSMHVFLVGALPGLIFGDVPAFFSKLRRF